MEVLEIMGANMPVAVSGVGENEVIIIDGETGLLVPSGDEKRLADAIRRLLDDPDLRNKLRCAAGRRYETEFTGRVMARRYEASYKSILQKGRPSR